MRILLYSITLLCIFITSYAHNEDNSTSFVGNKVLSRKKRFLIFPEGSSFQLVFCTTYPAIISIGDIVLWGNTAALAFELPQDPYSPFNHKADPLHRRMDMKHIYYTDENGKIIHKQPYKRKFLVNPAFAKRSVVEVNRKQMHASRERPGFSGLEANSVNFHRSSRIELYQKIELILQGLGGNGRECLLKTLCMYRESEHQKQGGFMQELLRTIFTLPKSQMEYGFEEEYDAAISSSGNCDELYPDCPSVGSAGLPKTS